MIGISMVSNHVRVDVSGDSQPDGLQPTLCFSQSSFAHVGPAIIPAGSLLASSSRCVHTLQQATLRRLSDLLFASVAA